MKMNFLNNCFGTESFELAWFFPDYPIPGSGTIPYSSKHTTGVLHILIEFFLFNATTLYLIVNAKFQIILASAKQYPYFKIIDLDFDSSLYIRLTSPVHCKYCSCQPFSFLLMIICTQYSISIATLTLL